MWHKHIDSPLPSLCPPPHHTHTHTHTHISQSNGMQEKGFQKWKILKKALRTDDIVSIMDKNRETETGKRKSADHWTLCGGRSSEHLSVCRRAELLGRSVKVKKIDLKGRWGLDERLSRISFLFLPVWSCLRSWHHKVDCYLKWYSIHTKPCVKK